MNCRCILPALLLCFSTTTFLVALFLHYHTPMTSDKSIGDTQKLYFEWLKKNRRFVDERPRVKSLFELHEILGLSIEDNLRIAENELVKNSVVNPEALSCTMSSCWNVSKCVHEFLVHIYPAPGTRDYVDTAPTDEAYEKILSAIISSGYYTANVTKACAFVLTYNTLDRDVRSTNFDHNLAENFRNIDPQLWNSGLNHILFNLYHGTYPLYAFDDLQNVNPGYASLARASTVQSRYRRHFDVALPLFHKELPLKLHPAELTALQRYNATYELLKAKYLISFKGKRYVYGRGSETRNSLYHLHDLPSKDTVLVTTCKHGTDWHEFQDDRCAIDNGIYDNYDYTTLLSTSQFCLVPRGRRLGSFRFMESLKLGCVPVILSDDWLIPFSEIIRWNDIVFRLDERRLFEVVDLLRSVPPERVAAMKQKCTQVYTRYFSSVQTIVNTVFEILHKRVQTAVRNEDSYLPLKKAPTSLYSGDLANFQFEQTVIEDPHFAAIYDISNFKFDRVENRQKEITKWLLWQLNQLRESRFCAQVFILMGDPAILNRPLLKREFSDLHLKFCRADERADCLTKQIPRRLAVPAIFAIHHSFPLSTIQIDAAMELLRWQPTKMIIFRVSSTPMPMGALFHRFYSSRAVDSFNATESKIKTMDFSCWMKSVMGQASEKVVEMPAKIVDLNSEMRSGTISGHCSQLEFEDFHAESALNSLHRTVQMHAVYEGL